VRIDGDDGVEGLPQQGAEVTLADDFAGMERDVLAHVGEIRRDQRQLSRAQLARRRRREQQLDELVVGPLQAAQHDDARRQCGRQRELRFAVGEAVARDHVQRPAELARQRVGEAVLVVEGEQHGQRAAHHDGPVSATNSRGGSPAAPMR
jgi:hypothetical protein